MSSIKKLTSRGIVCSRSMAIAMLLKKETGDRRQETGGTLHGDSLPQVMREHPR
ncbi:MAG: hypothetical protein F6K18_29945 [Okeania sp. SIO2C2]|uniref:hypothetical protein n=1 Tax=Okeania sp. SIO2C2 TaxID=2607787 RepID=UPI0013B96264|nr:hypothetical protein [Okeania sp. SIO2C2]NEP90701.1 hypothetical protein [Okeania sp. SIO2C2]